MNLGFPLQWTSEILAHAMPHRNAPAHKLALTKVPQVNHCIRQRFECVMELAEAIKPKQQAPELVFPTKDPFDGFEPLAKDGGCQEPSRLENIRLRIEKAIKCSKGAQIINLDARYQIKRMGKLLKYINLDYRV
jgi:hypothetical protein